MWISFYLSGGAPGDMFFSFVTSQHSRTTNNVHIFRNIGAIKLSKIDYLTEHI